MLLDDDARAGTVVPAISTSTVGPLGLRASAAPVAQAPAARRRPLAGGLPSRRGRLRRLVTDAIGVDPERSPHSIETERRTIWRRKLVRANATELTPKRSPRLNDATLKCTRRYPGRFAPSGTRATRDHGSRLSNLGIALNDLDDWAGLHRHCSPPADRCARSRVRSARAAPFLFGGFAASRSVPRSRASTAMRSTSRPYLWGQLLVTSFHLMVHFSNDYFDQASDALTTRTAWSGGSGVLAAEELPPRVALSRRWCALRSARSRRCTRCRTATSCSRCSASRSAVLAWCYSAPPVRLARARPRRTRYGRRRRGARAARRVCDVRARRRRARAVAATLPGVCAMFAMMLSVEIPDAKPTRRRVNAISSCAGVWRMRPSLRERSRHSRRWCCSHRRARCSRRRSTGIWPSFRAALIAGLLYTRRISSHLLEWASDSVSRRDVFGSPRARRSRSFARRDVMLALIVCGWR